MKMLSPPSLKMGALSALLSEGGLQKTQDNHRNHSERHCFSPIEAWVIPLPRGSSKELIVIKVKAYLGPSTKSMWLKSKTFAQLHNSGHRFIGEAEVRTRLFQEGGCSALPPGSWTKTISCYEVIDFISDRQMVCAWHETRRPRSGDRKCRLCYWT